MTSPALTAADAFLACLRTADLDPATAHHLGSLDARAWRPASDGRYAIGVQIARRYIGSLVAYFGDDQATARALGVEPETIMGWRHALGVRGAYPSFVIVDDESPHRNR